MKDTIKAKVAYRVMSTVNVVTGEKTNIVNVYDGERFLMFAELITLEELKNRIMNDESFVFCERFTSRKGTQYEYYYAESEENPLEETHNYIVKVGTNK